MAIIIDMNKPHKCGPCPFNVDDCYCKINESQIDRDDMTPDDGCPIIEVNKEAYEVERIINAYDGFINPEESKPDMIHHMNQGLDGPEELFLPLSQIQMFKIIQKPQGTIGRVYFNDGSWLGDLPVEVIDALKSYFNVKTVQKTQIIDHDIDGGIHHG